MAQARREGKTLPLKPLPLKVVYHTPCHMEKMGWTLYTLELLRNIPGLELTVLDSSAAVLRVLTVSKKRTTPPHKPSAHPLFRQIKKAAQIWWSPTAKPADEIEMSTSLRCEHPITLLAQALA